jgi:hypothetical protein
VAPGCPATAKYGKPLVRVGPYLPEIHGKVHERAVIEGDRPGVASVQGLCRWSDGQPVAIGDPRIAQGRRDGMTGLGDVERQLESEPGRFLVGQLDMPFDLRA